MKAYKVFNPDFTCRGFKYEVGKTYSIEGNPIMCERGFHACKKVADCFSYYSFDPKNKVAEVQLLGIILGKDEEKSCSNKIKIVKELTWNEMLILANSGIGNSGNRNSGDLNSGNRNSGDLNSGDWNSGFFNSQIPESILVFNKKCKREEWENATKPDFIYNLVINEWISWSRMTEEEKKDNPNAFVCDGYLKNHSYKDAWGNAYNKASSEDIDILKALPNFDPGVFFEITGIKIK